MKTMSKMTIGIVAAAFLFVGCGGGNTATSAEEKVTPTITEESLGLRKTDLYSEESTSAAKTEYRTGSAGSSAKIARAFQDAPPMVPHDTEGMLPITIADNQCTGCHMPDFASSMGATPIPVSHFTNFRPASMAIKGENTSHADLTDISIISEDKLVGARFNCTQCHAPQSQGNLAVENTFEAAYTTADGASSSSWSGSKLMEGIDTTK
jgi:cytochrome c-type protein NapB